jgi:hypothetical protein
VIRKKYGRIVYNFTDVLSKRFYWPPHHAAKLASTNEEIRGIKAHRDSLNEVDLASNKVYSGQSIKWIIR